jgi:TctA family transporter
MGSGQAAVIGSEIVGDIKKKEFLVLLGTINTLVTALSFVTLYSIAKARTGVAVAVGKLSSLTISELIFITIIILVAGLFAFYIT